MRRREVSTMEKIVKVLKSKSIVAFGLVAVFLSACASKPKPAVQEAAAPAAVTPAAPRTEVATAPLPPASRPPAPTPAATAPAGPSAGSLAEFQQSIGDRIYFATDRWDISDEAKAYLDRQAQWLNTYRGVQIMVSGNCDERGTREYNLALGARRAESVKNYLVGRGVDPGRIATVSYGKERPIDPRASEEGWAVNRNAQTQLTAGAAGV